jgi:hypothetical protein
MLLQLVILAQTSAGPPATPLASPTSPPAQKLICHFEDVGQTRIQQRICHTKAEWEQVERQAEDDFKTNMNKQNNPGNKPE